MHENTINSVYRETFILLDEINYHKQLLLNSNCEVLKLCTKKQLLAYKKKLFDLCVLRNVVAKHNIINPDEKVFDYVISKLQS